MSSILLVSLVFVYFYIDSKIDHESAKSPIYHAIPWTSTNGNTRGVMKKRFPQCIIFGTMKSGTTALKKLLAIHPRIRLADQEPHFFDRDDYKKGMGFYLDQMPLSYEDEITIEKTPSYFISAEAIERIYNFNKTIKLIVTFKDPVTRAISNFRQFKFYRSYITQTFEGFLSEQSGSLKLQRLIFTKGLYVEHLKKWYSYFPKEQIHIVDGENLIRDPIEELQLIEDFLGLEHRITKENLYFNKTTGFYCMRKDYKDKWRCVNRPGHRDDKPQYINPKFVQRLKEFYRPYNQQLFRLLNRTFDWD